MGPGSWSPPSSSACARRPAAAPDHRGRPPARRGGHHDMARLAGGPLDITAVGLAVHVGAMIVVMGAIAYFVYARVGLQILRRAWLNTDQMWAGGSFLAALATLTS